MTPSVVHSAASAPLLLENELDRLLSDFMSLLGLPVPPERRPLSDLGPAPPLELLARALSWAGRSARVVRVAPGELAELRLPTLVLLSSGKPAILLRVGRRQARLSVEGRPAAVPRRELWQQLTGDALDLSSSFPQRGAFLSRLTHALLDERARIGKLVLLSIAMFSVALLPPLVTRWAMDRAVLGEDASLLALLATALAATKLHHGWLALLRERASIALEGALEAAAQRGIFSHLVQLPFLVALRRPMGALLESLSSGVNVTRLLVGSSLLPVLDALMGCFYLALLVLLLPRVAAGCALTALASLGVVLVLGRRTARLEREHLTSAAAQQSFLHALLAGALTWKALAAEASVRVRWLSHFISEIAAGLRCERTELGLNVWLDASHKLTRVMVLIYGAKLVIGGELSLGSLLAYASFTDGFVTSTNNLFKGLLPLYSARQDVLQVDRQLSVLAVAREPSAPSAAAPESITLDRVWFRYSEHTPWVLRDFSLSVAPGEIHRLNAASGAGKTTILRLVAGLLEPEHGRVLLGGREAVQARGAVAYLPQEPVLFEGSLLENLRVLSGATLPAIVEASCVTGLHHWLNTLPMGLETILPPGGGTISGGQRQLLLLTAAVASQRPVLLLDEALAHLDPLTRADLRRRPLFRGKTVIEVLHEQ